MLLNFLYVLISLFFGSSLSKILTKILVFQNGFNIFSNTNENLNFLNQNTTILKSSDTIQLVTFIILSISLFVFLGFINKIFKLSDQQMYFVGFSQLSVSLLSNIFITFSGYSSVQYILFLTIWYILSVGLSFWIPKNLPKWKDSKIAFANGIITGFFLLIFTRHFVTLLALPISFLILGPIFFYVFSEKITTLKHPAFLLLFVSVFFSFNRIYLFLLLILVVVLLFLTKPNEKVINFFAKIYPFIIIFLFLYNPLFYFGNFDTVEEGFWASWLQRIMSGQHIYSDFAAHHPPGLIWGLYYFSKLFGSSLYNMRLYFHILQITGYFIFYFLINKLVKNKWIMVGTYLLVLIFISTFLRNNIEIRLSSSFLPIIFIYLFKKFNKERYLFISGFFVFLALLISTETGIASLFSSVVLVLLFSNKKEIFKNYFKYLLGLIIPIALVALIFIINGSFAKFVEYILFYVGNFSKGYQNIVLERPKTAPILEWYKIKQYFISDGFKWEFSAFIIVGTILISIQKKIKNKLNNKDALIIGLSLTGLVLMRSALARSDYYHISYVWIIGILLLGIFSEYVQKYSKNLPVFIFSFMLFFVGGPQNIFFQNQIFKLQSYANLSGSFPKYETKRSSLTANIDVNTKDTDDLIEYITQNTQKNDFIFIFVQEAELYFLADRNNATSFDNPTVFFSTKYQEQMVNELRMNKPKIIIYDPDFAIAGISVKTLNIVDSYIKDNYKPVKFFGKNSVLIPINDNF